MDTLIENSRKLSLFIDEDNTNAHLFYETLRFRHETTLKDHCYKNQDERVHTIFLLLIKREISCVVLQAIFVHKILPQYY